MFDPAHLVFLDETAANTKMMRVGGRCLRGERLIGQVPHGHWKTITFVGALRCEGMTAPYVIDGAMKGKTFLDYVEHHLAPTLRRNDTVVMDNLPAHKAAGVREAIEARGAVLRYLPQYSPDLNPIEMPFSKLKAYLRKMAERTIPRLRRRIRTFARNLTAREAKNYFRHAGAGVRILASGNGARCARTIALTVRPGIISLTIRRAAGPIAGARTASPVLATIGNFFVFPLHCGTAAIPS